MDLKPLLQAQRQEITENGIYLFLAKKSKNKNNTKILTEIAGDELKHYHLLKKYTHQDVSRKTLLYYFYLLVSTVLGITFALRLMERGEDRAIKMYSQFPKEIGQKMLADENKHEQKLLDLLSEKRIEYAGSIVLGLNDALVELTGSLAGLTFALNNGKLIAMTGMIIGFAASLSMAASAYLSSKEEKDKSKSASLSALFTGITYILTVAILILPYLLFKNIYFALIVMLLEAVFIIAFYTYYISVAKNTPFWKKFLGMVGISLSVAAISFGVGRLLKLYFGV